MALDVSRRRAEAISLPPVTSARRATPMVAVPQAVAPLTADWREGLPTLMGASVELRELEVADAPALLSVLTEREVSQFLAPPPTTAAGLRRFVRWTGRRRAEGRYACFAIVPRGATAAVGFFQVRAVEPGSTTAEWGFVLAKPCWGTGLFHEGASLLLDFAFGHMSLQRLEARAITVNGRANGALRKLGAVPEGILRQSYTIGGRHYDTTLWSILASDWRGAHRRPHGSRPRRAAAAVAHPYVQ